MPEKLFSGSYQMFIFFQRSWTTIAVNSTMKHLIFYIIITIISVVALAVAQAPAKTDQRLFIHTLTGQKLINAAGTEFKSYPTCINEYEESVLGPDDYIYGYQFYNKQVYRQDILTGYCEPIGPTMGDQYNPVKGLRFGPSGRYLYGLVGTSAVNKLDLVGLTWLPCLDAISNVFYQGVDFQNLDRNYLTVTYTDQSDSSFGHMVFDFDTANEVVKNRTELFRVPWFADYGQPVKCTPCPSGNNGSICCTSMTPGGRYLQAHAINNDVWTILMDATNPAISNSFFLYYHAMPWPQIYASGGDANLYVYDTAGNAPYTTRAAVRNSADVFHFHTLLAPPTIGMQWLGRSSSKDQWCKRQVNFPVYDWTVSTTIEVRISLDYPYQPVFTTFSPYPNQIINVAAPIDCSNQTNVARLRVQYYGPDKTVIRSMPIEIDCITAPAECLVKGTFLEVAPASQFVPNIVPILECISPLPNNNFLGYFGYNNLESSFYNIPVGLLNYFTVNTDRGQTTNFLSGRSEFFPRGAFTVNLPAGIYTWILTRYNLTFDTSDTAIFCPTNFTLGVQLTNSTVIGPSELNTMEANLAEQLGLSPEQVNIQGVKIVPAKKRSGNTLTELELEISTQDPVSNNPAEDPQKIVQDFISTAANATVAQEVFNPLNDTSREIVGVKTRPTGVETEGKEIPPANPVMPIASVSSASKLISIYEPKVAFMVIILAIIMECAVLHKPKGAYFK